MAERALLRSCLFAPGSDERKMSKAVRSGADAVVLDLEDSVDPKDKVRARETVARLIGAVAGNSACEIHVRVNRRDGGYDPSDISRVVVPGLAALRLPKCESASEVTTVAAMLNGLEAERGIPPGTTRLYPTIESAVGVIAAADIARAGPRVAALVFGPADFAASIGVSAPPFEATLVARSTLVLVSAAAGVGPPIDGAFLELADVDGLRDHSRRVRALGFMGKSAIHPRQIPILHDVFTPSPDEVERARRVIAVAEEGQAIGVVDGGFVDRPVVSQARAVLEMARRFESRGG